MEFLHHLLGHIVTSRREGLVSSTVHQPSVVILGCSFLMQHFVALLFKGKSEKKSFHNIEVENYFFFCRNESKMPFVRAFTIPGSREIFPAKREAKIHQFPGNSRPGKSREQALSACHFVWILTSS